MKKRILGIFLALCMVITAMPAFAADGNDAAAAAEGPRQMEYLTRGGFAANLTYGGVYLSWRLLGTEPMDTVFNVYKNGEVLVPNLNNTNYTDKDGTADAKYAVAPVINGVEGEMSDVFPMLQGQRDSAWKNSPYAYFDIPLQQPPLTSAKSYEANDASVGDVDGDGEYELVLKWEPDNAKDSAGGGVTDNVYLDCYEMDGTLLWRINLGRNIRAGQHYTQFQVFDYDGDGKAEMAVKTAPGSIDGKGNYVSAAGNTDEIKNTDNSKTYIGSNGHITGGPEYLTIFNGENGAAMQTVDYHAPIGNVRDWGDSNFNRSDRYLAATAYLDGVHPSIIECRGYYGKSVVAAYTWDGKDLKQSWIIDSTSNSDNDFYGQGNHNISVADLDNDGKDEIIYGSAALDDNGEVLWSAKNSSGRKLGHGDALHVSDFDNDGEQEVFKVLEDKPTWGRVFINGPDGKVIWHETATGDDGRGIMDNFSPKYGVLAWDSGLNTRTLGGEIVNLGSYNARNELVTVQDGQYPNFAIYWDGDIYREHFSEGRLSKWVDGEYQINDYNKNPAVDKNGNPLMNKGGLSRLWSTWTSNPVATNNSTKAVPTLQADLFGDWREELVLRHDDNSALRVFTSLSPSEYKFTTFMHDSQYRCAIAWQNTGYNQPPHQSYYIGADKDISEYKQPNIYVKTPDPEVIITVTDEAGNPAAGVSVSIGDTSKTTGEDGTVSLRVAAGTHTYRTESEKYFPGTGEITIESGKVNTFTIKLKEIPDSIITVKSGENTVAGASVVIGNRTLKSDEKGQIIAKFLPGDYDYAAQCRKYIKAYGRVTISETGSKDLIIEMQAIDYSYDSDKDANGSRFVYGDGEGAELSFNGGQWTFAQNSTDGGRKFGAEFDPTDSGKMTFEMTYGTGGMKDSNNEWNWTGRPYTHYIEFLDRDGNLLLGLSQEYKEGGAEEVQYYTDPSKKTNVSKGDVTGGPSITKRSASTWLITLSIDFTSKTATLKVMDELGENGYTISDIALGVTSFAKVEIGSTATGKVTWSPRVKNVLYLKGEIIDPTPPPTLAPTATPEVPTNPPATPVPTEPTPGPSDEPSESEPPAYAYTINSLNSENGVLTVNITKNYEVGDGKATLLTATYDKESGVLTGTNTAEIEMNLNQTKDIKINLPAKETDEIKAYIWNNPNEIIPIAAPKSK